MLLIEYYLTMKIGIIREEKQPNDKRVAFTPEQCKFVQDNYQVKITVQPSDWRCFSNKEYINNGINVNEDITDCDILFGIKEVPIQELIPNKKYLFFSHTIKKQAHNKKLLQAVLTKNIELIDYECLTDENANRIIGFGYYAGLVGTYNGILGYGKRFQLYNLKPAHLCHDLSEVKEELKKVHLPNIKIIVTGNGRVANGAIELLGNLGVRRVTPFEFTHYAFMKAVYTQLHSNDYNQNNNNTIFNKNEFYKNPENFHSTFKNYINHCDLLIHCSYWNPKAPKLFSKEEMRLPEFRIGVIADITCDINGSIPSTTQASTIENKFYGYNPTTEKIEEPFSENTITVMAVDNLPCELPRNASEDFGKELIEKVLPSLLVKDDTKLIERACIAKNNKLMPRFNYLKDFANV